MKDNKNQFLRNALAFFIGFVVFQIVWYFIVLPMIK